MVHTPPPDSPAEDDVRILEDRSPDGDVGNSWDVFFGRSETPMHSQKVETARRAAEQHARGHQVAVWLIVKGQPENRTLLYDHRRAHPKQSDT